MLLKHFLRLTLLLSLSFLALTSAADVRLIEASQLVGSWRLSDVGSIKISGDGGSPTYYSTLSADVDARACLYDDVFLFLANKSFVNLHGSSTWLEEWQTGDNEPRCGPPVAPHDGDTASKFEYSSGRVTVSGKGAYIGSPRPTNDGELRDVGAAVPEYVTYDVVTYSEEESVMVLTIKAREQVNWTFALVRVPDSDFDTDGVLDADDFFPADFSESLDADGDGVGDNADPDDDNDGFSDEQELMDGTNPKSRFSCKSGCFSFDVDESMKAQPLTDGLLVIRHLFGFSGESLTSGAVDTSAERGTSGLISGYLTDADSELDIDGDGESKPLTDGLLLIRYLFGFSGDSLISGAVGTGATRDTSEEVEAFIRERVPSN